MWSACRAKGFASVSGSPPILGGTSARGMPQTLITHSPNGRSGNPPACHAAPPTHLALYGWMPRTWMARASVLCNSGKKQNIWEMFPGLTVNFGLSEECVQGVTMCFQMFRIYYMPLHLEFVWVISKKIKMQFLRRIWKHMCFCHTWHQLPVSSLSIPCPVFDKFCQRFQEQGVTSSQKTTLAWPEMSQCPR